MRNATKLLLLLTMVVVPAQAAASFVDWLVSGGETIPCATPDPTDEELEEAHQAESKYLVKRAGEDETITTIPVCFHVHNQDDFDSAFLQTQLDALNVAFTDQSCCSDTALEWCNAIIDCSINTGFAFRMAVLDTQGNVVGMTPNVADANTCVTYTNNWWHDSINIGYTGIFSYIRRYLGEVHVGDKSVLNAVFGRIHRGGFFWFFRTTVLGVASMPMGGQPPFDGVMIHPNALIGSSTSSPNYTEGYTLAHDVGHWLGMFHPFYGSGCGDPGDDVADTPPQATGAGGCPVGRDTCPDDALEDPIHNIMQHTFDVCRYYFTPGQVTRMKAMWTEFRANGGE